MNRVFCQIKSNQFIITFECLLCINLQLQLFALSCVDCESFLALLQLIKTNKKNNWLNCVHLAQIK